MDFDGKLRANLAYSLSEQATNMLVWQSSTGTGRSAVVRKSDPSSAIAPFQCKQDKLHIVQPGCLDCVIYDRDVMLNIPEFGSTERPTSRRPHFCKI